MAESFGQPAGDVVGFLMNQHDLIKAKFDDVLDADDAAARRTALDELRQLLAAHENAEEAVIHPWVRREIAGGVTVVEARLSEERQAREKLAELEKMDVRSAQFHDALADFRDAVLMHAVREEDEEFARLQTEARPEDLENMATAVRAAEAAEVIRASTD